MCSVFPKSGSGLLIRATTLNLCARSSALVLSPSTPQQRHRKEVLFSRERRTAELPEGNLPKVRPLEDRGPSVQTQACLPVSLMLNGQTVFIPNVLPLTSPITVFHMQDGIYKCLPTMKTNRRAFNFFICNSQIMLAFFQKTAQHFKRQSALEDRA